MTVSLAEVDPLAAVPPDYQFRAANATLNAGNVLNIPNQRGADALTVPFGTIAAPVDNLAFGGAKTVSLSGSCLRSNLPIAAWNMLHKGDAAGYDIFLIGRRMGETGANQVLLTTRGPGGDPGFLMVSGNAVPSATFYASNNAGTPIYNSTNSLAWATGAATYVNVTHAEAAPASVRVLGFSKAALVATLPTNPPGTANCYATLQIGNGGVASTSQGALMELAELLVYKRRLPEYERQLVREYIQATYGIAAPVLTGPTRDMLALAPFSTMRADYYASTLAKVTAWLDRAMPGHSFSQGTAGNQVGDPSADGKLNNAMSAAFLGAQHYPSSLPAAAWAFTHDAAAFEAYTVFVPTAPGAASFLWGTYAGGPSVMAQVGGANALSFAAYNASAANITTGASDANALVSGERAVCRIAMGLSATPQFGLKVNGRPEVNVVLGVPSIAAPPSTMRLGTRGDLATPLQGRIAEVTWFNRILNASDRSRMSDYLLATYGGAP